MVVLKSRLRTLAAFGFFAMTVDGLRDAQRKASITTDVEVTTPDDKKASSSSSSRVTPTTTTRTRVTKSALTTTTRTRVTKNGRVFHFDEQTRSWRQVTAEVAGHGGKDGQASPGTPVENDKVRLALPWRIFGLHDE